MKPILRTLVTLTPGILVLLCAVHLVNQMRAGRTDTPMRMDMFGLIPVSGDGRVKPLDTVARTSLMVISGRQTLEHEGQTIPAITWLAEVITKPDVANDYAVFQIEHPEVLGLVGVEDESRGRVSFNAILPHAAKLQEQARAATLQPAGERSLYQRHVLQLWRAVTLYLQLARLEKPYILPPVAEGQDWQTIPTALAAAEAGQQAHPQVGRFWSVLSAFHEDDAPAFNAATAEYLSVLSFNLPDELSRAQFEMLFNRLQPFKQGLVLYLLAFLLVCVSFFGLAANHLWARTLWQTAVLIVILTFIVHTFGLIGRMYLQDRWWVFVTNLYSSAVFIGWFCVLLGLILEAYFRNGLGTLIATVTGFTTLVIAVNLADGDTMQMMQAVLDSNFWLATHVTTVTIGYSAVFVAGLAGIVFIFLGLLTRVLADARIKRMLGTVIYGVVAFALLFSFVGTVLGGIWADQSWGRFWGWDPKENGAVLIVLMMALILHARWGGMIRERGMAVLAVGGNIITAWSWFGTNMLGVGLHSYGFMDSAMLWLLAFVVSQLAIIAAGLLPLRWWASFAQPAPDAPSPQPLAA